jgi:hypothetical protein
LFKLWIYFIEYGCILPVKLQLDVFLLVLYADVLMIFYTLTGVSSLINLLSSAQDEDQPKLNVLLCEAVVAVYLSLLIHALATNSSNELFRLAAHPLNNRMWAAVFGGGVKLVVKPRRQSENISGKILLVPTLYIIANNFQS